jgi:ubiquinone/menaquinone biosynthesis C-methylase UbiE
MTTQMPPTGQIRQAWESVAPRFDECVSPLTMTFGQAVVDKLGVGPGTVFLDVGAGSGALAIPVAQRGANVLAIGLAPTMIERLGAHARGLPNLRGRVMDGGHLDLSDNSFDVAASVNGVTLFPDVSAGIAEMVRVTKPGGRVVLVCFAHGIEYAEFVTFLFAAVRTAVPDAALPQTDPPPLPFQLADPQKLRTKLVEGGLTDVSGRGGELGCPGAVRGALLGRGHGEQPDRRADRRPSHHPATGGRPAGDRRHAARAVGRLTRCSAAQSDEHRCRHQALSRPTTTTKRQDLED